MKITSKQLNKLAEKAAKSALKAVIKEQVEGLKRGPREDLAVAYSLLTRNIDPSWADMNMEYKKVVPLLLSTPYYDEVEVEELDPEIQQQLDDVVVKYGTQFDDDIVSDAKEFAKRVSKEWLNISFDGLNEQVDAVGDGKLAWLFRFRAENGLSNEELLEDVAEICQGNETVWKYLVRGLKNKYGYKVG